MAIAVEAEKSQSIERSLCPGRLDNRTIVSNNTCFSAVSDFRRAALRGLTNAMRLVL